MTRFRVNPTWILRVPRVSFDSIADAVETLSRSRDVAIRFPKFLCFGDTNTLVCYCKNGMRIGEPIECTSSRIVENTPGKRLTPSAMKTAWDERSAC